MTGMVGRLMGGFGGGGGGPAADLWEKTLWPNFPSTTLASNLRVANVTTLNMPANATIADVTGPNGELGVQVSVINSSSRLSFPTFSPIDLSTGNIEIDFRVPIEGGLANGTDLTIAVSSGGVDPLNTSNSRSVSIASKLSVHNAGPTNMYTMCIPNNRIATVNGTGATMTAITGIRISTNNTAGVDPVIQVFAVRFRPNPRISAATPVIFRFDGGSVSQYNYALPALVTAFGDASAAFLTFTKRVLNQTDFLTDAQFQEWLDAGAEYAPHGGFTTDAVQADRAAYYAEHAPHRQWAKQYGIDNGYPDLDHTSSFGTYYSSVTQKTVGFRQTSELDRLYRCQMQFNSATGGGTPMSLGGAAFPPSRWNMEATSANSWDDTSPGGAFPTDADAITSITAVMDQARANRGYACFAWHEGIDTPGRSQLVFTTVRDKILAEPSNFVAMGPNAMLDPYLVTYGGIT